MSDTLPYHVRIKYAMAATPSELFRVLSVLRNLSSCLTPATWAKVKETLLQPYNLSEYGVNAVNYGDDSQAEHPVICLERQPSTLRTIAATRDCMPDGHCTGIDVETLPPAADDFLRRLMGADLYTHYAKEPVRFNLSTDFGRHLYLATTTRPPFVLGVTLDTPPQTEFMFSNLKRSLGEFDKKLLSAEWHSYLAMRTVSVLNSITVPLACAEPKEMRTPLNDDFCHAAANFALAQGVKTDAYSPVISASKENAICYLRPTFDAHSYPNMPSRDEFHSFMTRFINTWMHPELFSEFHQAGAVSLDALAYYCAEKFMVSFLEEWKSLIGLSSGQGTVQLAGNVTGMNNVMIGYAASRHAHSPISPVQQIPRIAVSNVPRRFVIDKATGLATMEDDNDD